MFVQFALISGFKNKKSLMEIPNIIRIVLQSWFSCGSKNLPHVTVVFPALLDGAGAAAVADAGDAIDIEVVNGL